jgi:hypothetical protein
LLPILFKIWQKRSGWMNWVVSKWSEIKILKFFEGRKTIFRTKSTSLNNICIVSCQFLFVLKLEIIS